jgi:hypothetical protein
MNDFDIEKYRWTSEEKKPLRDPVYLEEMRFQKQWKEHFQRLIRRQEPGYALQGQDHLDMAYLVKNYHPEAEIKVGAGISFFMIVMYPHPHILYIFRTDGTWTDVSWNAAVQTARGRGSVEKRRKRTRTARDKSYYRDVVSIQIEQYKQLKLKNGPCCPITGEKLYGFNSAVHHELPFADMLAIFEENYTGPEEGKVEAWVQFHKDHARLSLLSLRGHGQIHRKGNGT